MRALAVCRPISKLDNIASWVLCRIAVFLLVLLAGVDSSLASTSGGAAVFASLIYLRCMFRGTMRGDRRGSATLVRSSVTVWAVGTFGYHCGGGTLGNYIPVSTTLCVVLEGMGGYR